MWWRRYLAVTSAFLERTLQRCLLWKTRGRDAGDILNTVLGAFSRPEEAARLFDLFNCAVDEERFGDARLALQKLEEFVGMDDPDVVAAKTTLELEELLS